MDENQMKVPKRILNTLLSSLAAGVVPRSGAPYIAIGRKEEIASLLGNLDEVAEGGAAVRFLIGTERERPRHDVGQEHHGAEDERN